ncbi:MAG: type II toxin-antitoxin system PemK/MazF family toxin [Actinomycetota bacterium]|nr:type II toxin-antitoxin system PemK/MazF family toxin [Actinomycetota bacterium]
MDSPGQSGADATTEVDPAAIGTVAMSYSPHPDGEPDPGEVIWTWVPFEERDGRGKDRPVLLVAAEPAGTFLGVQLTSKRHEGADYIAVGSGGWDGEHRPSWAHIDRIIRLHSSGMRREGTALEPAEFAEVTGRLRQRYGWTDSERPDQ